MIPAEQTANAMFLAIVQELEQEPGGNLTAVVLGDKLRHWAWDRTVAGMMKPSGEQVRHPHYAQPETD